MKLSCTKRWYKLFSVLLILLFVFQMAASAEGPYINYNYDTYKTSEATPTAAGYLPDQLISGDTLGVGAMKNPTDLYYDNNQYLYVLDSGNNRVLVLNNDLKLDHSISFTDASGNAVDFQEADGVFVDKSGKIYVADKQAALVYIFNSKGSLLNTIGSPDSDVFSAARCDFRPTKVMVDNTGMIYVISDGCYQGALQFTADYQFIGFYGSDTVVMTPSVVATQALKKILPKSLAARLTRAVPTNYNNFDIDSQGFVYTTKVESDTTAGVPKGQVRKLNYFGNNILWYQSTNHSRSYGDMKILVGTTPSQLIDVDVDNDGIINVLDYTRDRVFQYDQDSNLLFVFGGPGDQFGCFNSVSAIEDVGGNVLVLDYGRDTITVMKPTYFANQVHAAVKLFHEGKYENAEALWKDVLKYDSNYSLANIGLGKAYESEGKYQQSLKYFKQANDGQDYSDSFYNYRSVILHDYFPVIMICVIAIIAALLIRSAIKKKHRKNEYELETSIYRFPLFVMNHPFKGYTALKDEKKGSLRAANVIVLLFFIVSIFVQQNTGFLFSSSRPEDFNIFYTTVGTVGIFLLWVVSNWASSTLMDGEGKFTEIWIFSSYALLPYVLFMIPLTLLSDTFTLNESPFFMIIKFIIYAWVCIGMLMAIREVHQFTTARTIFSIALTFLGMIVMAAIYAIVYSMFMELVSFIGTLANEISLRL